MDADIELRTCGGSTGRAELLVRLMYDRADVALLDKAAAQAIDLAIAILTTDPNERAIDLDRPIARVEQQPLH